VDVGRGNVQRLWLCRATPYLTCELCDFDICKRCYEIESLPPDEKDREVERRLDKTAAEEAETKDALKQKNVPDWMRKRGDGNGTNASTSNAWRNYMEMT
jgi:hypothetical protein